MVALYLKFSVKCEEFKSQIKHRLNWMIIAVIFPQIGDIFRELVLNCWEKSQVAAFVSFNSLYKAPHMSKNILNYVKYIYCVLHQAI